MPFRDGKYLTWEQVRALEAPEPVVAPPPAPAPDEPAPTRERKARTSGRRSTKQALAAIADATTPEVAAQIAARLDLEEDDE
jgi:hypothetical protein